MRHVRPLIQPGICYGRTDVSPGESASQEITAALRGLPPLLAIISSPAVRCTVLAEALAARDRLTLQRDARLLELDFGQWEGRAWDAIDRAEIDRWSADLWTVTPGGGESLATLWQRVIEFGEHHQLARWRSRQENLLIVAHQGSLRALWAVWAMPEPVAARETFFATSFDFGLAGLRELPVNQNEAAAF